MFLINIGNTAITVCSVTCAKFLNNIGNTAIAMYLVANRVSLNNIAITSRVKCLNYMVAQQSRYIQSQVFSIKVCSVKSWKESK